MIASEVGMPVLNAAAPMVFGALLLIVLLGLWYIVEWHPALVLALAALVIWVFWLM